MHLPPPIKRLNKKNEASWKRHHIEAQAEFQGQEGIAVKALAAALLGASPRKTPARMLPKMVQRRAVMPLAMLHQFLSTLTATYLAAAQRRSRHKIRF